ncbi:MAG: hypothetical protein Q7S78_00540 [Candidatus Azambacteria bacterium]|nr:hypothetical protein [Candidatus Azambacteria bacterium]
MITIPTPPSGTFGSYKITPPKKNILPYLIIIAATVILAAGYYFFFYKNVDISFETIVLVPAPPLTPLEVKLVKIPKFSLEVVDSAFYKSLRIYGTLPVVADSLGRANPFIPY